MQYLVAIDYISFGLINGLPHTEFTDTVFKIVSGMGAYGLVWILMGILTIIREERKDHHFIKPILATAVLSYVLTDLILKPVFQRHRPDPLFGAIISGDQILTDYSFPSGHATVAFALACVLSYKEPRYRILFYTLALIIAFSRIYLGYHFPTDTIGGAVLGIILGTSVLYLHKNLRKGKGKKSAFIGIIGK